MTEVTQQSEVVSAQTEEVVCSLAPNRGKDVIILGFLNHMLFFLLADEVFCMFLNLLWWPERKFLLFLGDLLL